MTILRRGRALCLAFESMRSLCRSVTTAMAPGVYSVRRSDGTMALVPAADSGYEGVACVDDAARLLVLLVAVELGLTPPVLARPVARRLIAGLADFLHYMQLPCGRFANFVLDWNGTRNLTGPTSRPGGTWWTGRALRGLCWAGRIYDRESHGRAFREGLSTVGWQGSWDEESAVVWALIDSAALSGVGPGRSSVQWVDRLCAESDLPFRDLIGSPSVHLWGRTQELVVARVAAACHNAAWLAAARESCHLLLRPLARTAFAGRDVTLPYEVSSTHRNLAVVAALTGDPELRQAARWCREWFWGRNRAGIPMLDARTGLISDGIDGDRRNANSGAEAGIETLCAIAVTSECLI